MRAPTPEEIKSLRKQLGLSQEALAEKLGVSFSTVNRWERGHRAPTRLALIRLEALARGQVPSSGVPWLAEAVARLDLHRFGIALRDRIVVLNAAEADAEEPAFVIQVEPDLGSLRSLRQAKVQGHDVLLAGARDGVWMIPWPPGTARPVRFPFGSRSGEKMGVNSTLVAHGHLYATHSERGLVRWSLEHPANAERLHARKLASSRTVRSLTLLDADRFLFAADDRLYVSQRGAGELDLLFREPEGGRITATVLHEHTLYVATSEGSLFGFDLVFRRTQPLLIHEKAPLYTLGLVQSSEETYLVVGAKKREVSVLHLEPSGDRLHFKTCGPVVRAAAASPSHVVAMDSRQTSLLVWDMDAPSRPESVVEIYEAYGQHIQDVCPLRLPEISR